MPPQPLGALRVEFEFAALDWTMISFADVDHPNRGKNRTGIPRALAPPINFGVSCNREAHGIPCPLPRRPGTTAGIAKIAKCLENIGWGVFILMSGSGAVAAPSTAQRKS